MNRTEKILQALIKNRSFKCKKEWLDLDEYSEYEKLRKMKLVRRNKIVIEGTVWYIYKCTTKAEQLYYKIKK